MGGMGAVEGTRPPYDQRPSPYGQEQALVGVEGHRVGRLDAAQAMRAAFGEPEEPP